ncbi:MAG: DUF1963 domain-containing protein [Hyphomonadaceae bacterium]
MPASAQNTDPAARARIETFLNRMARPGIAIVRGQPSPNITTNSYFGGLPRMPPELGWPTSTITNTPMFFAGQIDLADLPAIADRQGLPEQGVLWFFLAYDGIVEERERVAVLYDPRSGINWSERAAPAGLARIIDETPYLLLDASDPFARLDLPRPMRFATIPTYALSGPIMDGEFSSEAQEIAETARRTGIEAAFGPMRDGPNPWEVEHGPTPEGWPYSGFTAELAAGVVAISLPDPDTRNERSPNARWTHAGLRLRAQIAEETEAQQQRWRSRRFEPLSAEQRAEFRAWIASVNARAEAMPTEQTGGYRLFYNLDYYFQQTDLFAGYAGLARGTDIALPPDYRAPHDWISSGPLLDQMLGYGFSWQSAPQEHFNDTLLLQITGSDDTFWLPECMLHFWISRRALAERRFDYTTATLECD